jgi:predicted DNA-binding transcriptional regulator AlpA
MLDLATILLIIISRKAETMDIEKRLLKIQEVAAMFQVTVRTITKWCARGGFPHEKYNGQFRFDPDAIEAYRQAHSSVNHQ